MDLDGDGIKDIISGNYVTDNDKGIGSVHILKGLGNGRYANATEVLDRKGNPVVAAKIGDDETYDTGQICIHPFAVDWEGDGDLDFVIGNFAGSFTLVLNEKKKDAKQNAFEPMGSLIKTDGTDQILNAGQIHSAPFIMDWDGDGDLDLLAATAQSPLSLAENAGSREKPRFKEFRQLITVDAGEKQAGTVDGPAGSFRSWIADVNGDGKHDVLTGDSFSKEQPRKGLSEKEFEKRKKEWQAKMTKAQTALQEFQPQIEKMLTEGKDPGEDSEFMARYQKAMEPMQQLYEEREEFLESTMTGRVWLYLAK